MCMGVNRHRLNADGRIYVVPMCMGVNRVASRDGIVPRSVVPMCMGVNRRARDDGG